MNEHSVSAFSDGTDISLGYAILVVGVDTTITDMLLLLSTMSSEVFRAENTIIDMVKLDIMIMWGGMKFKRVLCREGLITNSI
jgi:hypothetical protein